MPASNGREELFRPTQFPRSAGYDPDWVLENMMGPNALWLTEALAGSMDLEPAMRVLDMGCGKGLSSIFLARGVRAPGLGDRLVDRRHRQP